MVPRRQLKWLFFLLPEEKEVLGKIITTCGFYGSVVLWDTQPSAGCSDTFLASSLIPPEERKLAHSLKMAAGGASTSTLRATIRITWASGRKIIVQLDHFRKDCFHAKRTSLHRGRELMSPHRALKSVSSQRWVLGQSGGTAVLPWRLFTWNRCRVPVCKWSHLAA